VVGAPQSRSKFSLEQAARTWPYRGSDREFVWRDYEGGLPDKPPLPLPENPPSRAALCHMSDDKSQEYFSDGLTEEIITALSKTTSVRDRPELYLVYKGKPVKSNKSGRELGVKYVLEAASAGVAINSYYSPVDRCDHRESLWQSVMTES